MALLTASFRTVSLGKSLARDAALVLNGSVLLALSAKIQVPFWPVPMTMQTFVVLMIGANMGARLAVATVLAYLIEGAVGLPVFSTGAGLAFMAGPTGGYLMGFLAAALVLSIGLGRRFGQTRVGMVALFLLADGAIMGSGFAWLALLIGSERAFDAGILPFLPAEMLKLALAMAATLAVQTYVSRRSDSAA
jgi:biotin transport system substrate-specific component